MEDKTPSSLDERFKQGYFPIKCVDNLNRAGLLFGIFQDDKGPIAIVSFNGQIRRCPPEWITITEDEHLR